MSNGKKQVIVVIITVVVTLVIVGLIIGLIFALNNKSKNTENTTESSIYVVAEGFADSENYKEALGALDQASDAEKNSKKYVEEYNKYKDKYIGQVVKKVGELKTKKQYTEAIEEINAATAVVGKNEILDQELKDVSKKMKGSSSKSKKKTKRKNTNSKSSKSSNSSNSEIEPFYGIWTSASKSESEAQKEADKLTALGFDGRVFVTTDWSNLNKEKWYVVTAGVYARKAVAEADLPSVKKKYSGAYVKFSGNYIK